MKIGILKETKTPVDNRVALTPDQVKDLKEKYPNISIKVQSSDVRAYSDEEYRDAGIEVTDDVSDCDFLMGIKEAAIDTLMPDKHYLFFGHIAKMQSYNKPLFKTLLNLNTTFSDYEYLVGEDGIRLVAFGWYAGVVGVYYTLMGWGKKTGKYELPMPHLHFTIEEIIGNLKKAPIGDVKIVVTGSGRVSHGAQHILRQIGAIEYSCDDFCKESHFKDICYCVAPVDKLVAPNDESRTFDFNDFVKNPSDYHQTFTRFAESADILLSCHFWSNDQPVYLTEDGLKDPNRRIKMIGDITCDIQGSIKSTVRSSTHADPFFDYNPATGKEEPAFSSPSNISVMAVDTCPNALPRETSRYFGENLIKYVLDEMLSNDTDRSQVMDRATIIRNGQLTDQFDYLKDYVATL